MKIAIASTGLGHVARGIETWALDSANALHRKGADITLFAAGEVESEAPLVVIPCIRRRTPLSNFITKLAPPFTWRWGFKSGYGLEQLTFWKHLKKQLNAENFDILHIQDPMIADLCRKARAKGEVTVKEILAHGTEEPLTFLANFDYLQHLAPWHLEQSLKTLGEVQHRTSNIQHPTSNDEKSATSNQPTSAQRPLSTVHPPHSSWTAMPNFIDTTLYRPIENIAEKQAIRRKLNIPEDAFVIGTAAAIKKHHKRIDYLIREFAAFVSTTSNRKTVRPALCARHPAHRPGSTPLQPYLIIAGSHQNDTEELQALAEKLCPGQIKFLINHPHKQMPDLLRSYDAFVLTSIFEMMPIALLEAIATGLPVITNNHPVLEWMGGPGGIRPDMSKEGALAETFANLTDDEIEKLGSAARQHALDNYSEETVIQQYLEYYKTITTEETKGGQSNTISPPRH